MYIRKLEELLLRKKQLDVFSGVFRKDTWNKAREESSEILREKLLDELQQDFINELQEEYKGKLWEESLKVLVE